VHKSGRKTPIVIIIIIIIFIIITHIINQSLQTGIVPDQMKTAKAVPIYKSSDQSIKTIYRPISVYCQHSQRY